MQENLFPHVRIVLVETSHPGNIGASARAMKNMGAESLVLVNPGDYPSDQATWRAAGAADVLEAARVVPDLDSAIADCSLVIGASARDRRIPWPLLDPRSCGEKVVAEMSGTCRVALLFGRESRGLKNEELRKCQFHVNIPTAKAYSSLNLAMAVQVICYELLRALEAGSVPRVKWDIPLASSRDMDLFFTHLEQTLIDVDFHDAENPRQLMVRLRRLFNRIRPDQMEINILRGILAAINQKMRRP